MSERIAEIGPEVLRRHSDLIRIYNITLSFVFYQNI